MNEDQFQSKSLNTGSLIEGTISDATIDEDEYVVWGHNNASAGLGSTYDGLSNSRITRIWKVTATGSPGSTVGRWLIHVFWFERVYLVRL